MIMKTYAILVTLLLLCVSCSSGDKAPAYPFTASVVVLSSVEGNNGPAHFKIEPREFTTLRNLDKLQGDYLNVTWGGELKIKEMSGSIVQGEKFEGGTSPLLRYTVKSGVVVPRDYSTLVLLSAYYQFEQVFIGLQSKLGLSLTDLLAKAANQRFQLMYEPAITLESSEADATHVAKLNAAYMPGQKQFILFRRSPIEDLPLATNLQVISHEFGHAIFEKVFYKDESSPDNRYDAEYAMRGFNEGFADYISLVYSGTTDIMSGSINILGKAEERNFGKVTFNYDTYVNSGEGEGPCTGEFYCIGTIFARSLLQARNELSANNVLTADQFTLEFITALSGTLEEMKKIDLPSRKPDEKEGKEKDIKHDPRVIGAFLNALIGKMPTASRKTLCNTFADTAAFGGVGFPSDLRRDCGS